MRHHATRREFLATATAAAAGVRLLGAQAIAGLPTTGSRKKSLIGVPKRDTLETFKAAGFDGIESRTWNIPSAEAAKQRETAEQMGLKVHSVLRGWTNFNSPDHDKVAKDIASVTKALSTAQAYGADAVLLVPCRLLAKVDVPAPEDFQIEFNEKTGHVTRVVRGDNAKYQGYIKAQNEAVDSSRKALEKLIPAAERAGVVIALENVWSDLWVKPNLFANFVTSFNSRWIQSYFDIGNHVKYALPEHWIRALGKTIVKIHVKDFTIERSAPKGGRFVNIRDGDVNWPAVMHELDKINYHGWMTIEGSGGLPIEERSRRLDLILAGK